MKRAVIISGILTVAIVAAVVYFCYDPSKSQWFPQCIFFKFTGYKCPGCGTQRAIHSILNGDFAAAWHFNAALFVAIPIILLFVVAGWCRQKVPALHDILNSPLVAIIILVLVVLWWVGRNIVNV